MSVLCKKFFTAVDMTQCMHATRGERAARFEFFAATSHCDAVGITKKARNYMGFCTSRIFSRDVAAICASRRTCLMKMSERRARALGFTLACTLR
jgi:hypothetical protein